MPASVSGTNSSPAFWPSGADSSAGQCQVPRLPESEPYKFIE